jgi:hypothetical protein
MDANGARWVPLQIRESSLMHTLTPDFYWPERHG